MLLELKMRILKAFGYQYKAARALGIRDDELSAFLRGRKELTEDQLRELGALLQLNSSEMLEAKEAVKQLFHGDENE